MAGPFKMKSGNSPMFKAMGSSPVYNKQTHELERETSIPMEGHKVDQNNSNKKNNKGKKQGYELNKMTPQQKILNNIGEDETKEGKGSWFGLPDFGVTEAAGKIIDYIMPKR